MSFYKHLKRLCKEDAVYKQSVVGPLNSYTQAQSLDGLVDNNISPADKTISNPTLKNTERKGSVVLKDYQFEEV